MKPFSGVGSVVLVTALSLSCQGEAVDASLSQQSDGLNEWRENLAAQTRDGSMWWTSNEAYMGDGDGIDSYGMRFVLIPGGVAARGCLWGFRGEEIVGPFWEFFAAWDPVEEKALLYQVSPDGTMGLGHRWIEDGLEIADQTFRGTDGTSSRVRHETRDLDENTHEGSSFDWVDGSWAPRRTYTWVRRSGEGAPC